MMTLSFHGGEELLTDMALMIGIYTVSVGIEMGNKELKGCKIERLLVARRWKVSAIFENML